MKVVMVGPFGLRPKRTMAARALPMARALVRRGHAVTIVLPPWSNPADAGTPFVESGVRVINLPLPPRFPIVFELWLALSTIRQAMALGPDVIHCFKPKAYAGTTAWAAWMLKRMGRSNVRLVIDSDDWEGTGGWNEVERYSPLLKRLFSWQERWGLAHADAITVASRALQTLAWSVGAAAGKVYYVPNGASEPSAADGRSPASPATLLLYTRFVEFGLQRIVSLIEVIAARNPDLGFLIVGQGLHGEDEEFRRLVGGEYLQGRIEILGWVPEQILPDVFARATLAIFPYDDTLLNRAKCSAKLIDLLWAGVPVVAEAVGEVKEFIVHEQTGLLVPPGDTAMFISSVELLLSDGALRQRVSAGARRRIEERFLWSNLSLQVERAYRE